VISDPTAVFVYLAGVLGAVYWLSGLKPLARVFEIAPAILWAYFVPMVSTTLGITPADSPAYDWMVRHLLPVSLFLLMVTVDVPALLKLGRPATIMMLTGTVGIIIGGPIALAVFGTWLPADAWKGLGALSGSWIGGTANLVAVAESIGTPDAMFGPIIVVDTVVGYGWMGVLLFLSAYQLRFDRWNNADTSLIEETNAALAAKYEAIRRPITIRDLAMIVGVGFVAAYACVLLGERMPELGDPRIISHTTWAVVLVTTLGLTLSFTRINDLEGPGASSVGFVALYLLVTAIGAQGDLRAIIDAPLFLATGALWIAIHVGLLLLVARLIRAPLFFVATGSMAVAGVYHPAMAPIGLLMGVSGYVLGIYGGLACAWLLGQVAIHLL
jgi:uncharacterized membrane protein